MNENKTEEDVVKIKTNISWEIENTRQKKLVKKRIIEQNKTRY